MSATYTHPGGKTFTVRFLDGPCTGQSRTVYDTATVGLVITVRETGKTRVHEYVVTSVLKSGMWLMPAATAKFRPIAKGATQPRSRNEELAARIVAMSSSLKVAP